MDELEIPVAAYDAADAYLATKSDDQDTLGAVDAAAPYIVAAELRRIADQISIGREVYVRYGESDIRRAAAEEGLKVAKALCGRADELDGGAR